jgi:hypothetical protein
MKFHDLVATSTFKKNQHEIKLLEVHFDVYVGRGRKRFPWVLEVLARTIPLHIRQPEART